MRDFRYKYYSFSFLDARVNIFSLLWYLLLTFTSPLDKHFRLGQRIMKWERKVELFTYCFTESLSLWAYGWSSGVILASRPVSLWRYARKHESSTERSGCVARSRCFEKSKLFSYSIRKLNCNYISKCVFEN